VRSAIELFEQAIEIDPTYAPAHAGLADARAILGSWFGALPTEEMPKAREAAEQALALDDSLAEAHASLGAVKAWYDWDFAGAAREYERAIELNPGYATAYFWYRELLRSVGRTEEADAMFRRARALDPVSPVMRYVAAMEFSRSREYDRAVEACAELHESEPGFLWGQLCLGTSLVRAGRHEEGLRVLRQAAARWPDDPQAIKDLAQGLALSGEEDEARALIGHLRTPDGRDLPTRIAAVYASLGDRDQAFHWLERAYEEREREVTSLLIEADNTWSKISDDPRFADLVKRVGLPSS
jgi:serine/threonine-protein kinase